MEASPPEQSGVPGEAGARPYSMDHEGDKIIAIVAFPGIPRVRRGMKEDVEAHCWLPPAQRLLDRSFAKSFRMFGNSFSTA